MLSIDGSPSNRRAFWDRHPGLVWSNPNAPDDAFIAAALRAGRFLELLDMAVEFGVDRLCEVWDRERRSGELSGRAIRRTEETLAIFKEARAHVLAARD